MIRLIDLKENEFLSVDGNKLTIFFWKLSSDTLCFLNLFENLIPSLLFPKIFMFLYNFLSSFKAVKKKLLLFELSVDNLFLIELADSLLLEILFSKRVISSFLFSALSGIILNEEINFFLSIFPF